MPDSMVDRGGVRMPGWLRWVIKIGIVGIAFLIVTQSTALGEELVEAGYPRDRLYAVSEQQLRPLTDDDIASTDITSIVYIPVNAPDDLCHYTLEKSHDLPALQTFTLRLHQDSPPTWLGKHAAYKADIDWPYSGVVQSHKLDPAQLWNFVLTYVSNPDERCKTG